LGEGLEESAMSLSDEKRETNAARLMQRFSDRPYSTWLTIEKQLAPYIQRLKTKRPGLLTVYKREMDEIHAAFEHDEYCLDKQLSGEFLLGFHCQRADLNQGKSNDTGNEKFNNEENNEEEI
jgi:CRISPR-associated protein Csd1